VLEGQIKFNTDEQSVELGAVQMLAMHGKIPHSVVATTEAVFLLTLTTTLEEK
jgi:quercetin dioxygenase-like cupin family protein